LHGEVCGNRPCNATHDANDSITRDGINTFTYDTQRRMTGASTGLGSLTYKLVDSTSNRTI
jgi:hypothetical protein